MARILISESHPEVRKLLIRMVSTLGHEPVCAHAPRPGFLDGVDVVLVEPATPSGAVLAYATQLIDPEMPIVCVTVAPDPEINVAFAAILVKPFTLLGLGCAIQLALGRGRIPGAHG